MAAQINKTVLMSGADYFSTEEAINAFMDSSLSVDRARATEEHLRLKTYLEQVGIDVIQVPPPDGCQDGVYTANWALVRDDQAVMASLPSVRQPEVPYAERKLRDMGIRTHHVPKGLKFSGQGDALACGNYLFMNHGYRTDLPVHKFVAQTLGYEVISLQTVPLTDSRGAPVVNTVSGWPDSYFYDIDLALSIIRAPCERLDLSQNSGCRGLIAWCPEAFTPESQKTLHEFDGVDKIEVSLEEAKDAFACNLVSTGETVIMRAYAPQLRAELEARGFDIVTPDMSELAKGGGFIRCTTLALA